ncbi:hypothetical protein S7711_10189 [Stachybotrys chartarum IBT 7711]|uniref:Nephrocystin 3-like N-terminal domain-containing protein n=1 Tax=Stachybotrys chartarum (strain CBS 109288 / IBT 7711) TaxID=1280523 RepID=A0A084B876_STACB|nr:hypothetical protein S7711_10189 [Stachybotrys chartarum IBT 7711]
MPGSDWSSNVYRLRKLPTCISGPREAARLLGEALAIDPELIVVCSLAKTADGWETVSSSVATVQLKTLPQRLREQSHCDEWELASHKLILDTHFRGLTALNDVDPNKHHSDCIAISGLSSHPFGSWQPHGPNKSYMWIRDELPASVPGVRCILYGYDSALTTGSSFQSISDIGLGFVHQLRAGGWNLALSKPIIFLAHSLGGLVLKEALIQLADRNASITGVLMKFRGAIMFGVPSLGMHQTHLISMVEGQANENLVQDLSCKNGSSYLRQLNKSFEGISFTRTAKIFWAYETKESKTVVKLADGSWDRNGPPEILVNPDSATSHRNRDSKSKWFTVPINEDHTNMVKFTRGSANLGTVVSLVADLCGVQSDPLQSSWFAGLDSHPGPHGNLLVHDPETPSVLGEASLAQDDRILERLSNIFSSLEELHFEIESPELDFRVDQIENPFQGTFRWIYDLPSFCEWLQRGSGLFWIHGKPGSGKSTLMKFIFKSRQTWELLHDWTRTSYEVTAAFFFHHRGTSLQRSFEGVLRSLVIQVLSPHYQSFRRQHQNTSEQYKQLKKKQTRLDRKQVQVRAGLHRAELMLRRVSGELQDDIWARGLLRDLSEMEKVIMHNPKEIRELVTSRGRQLKDLEAQLDLNKRQLASVADHFQAYTKAAEMKFLEEIVSEFRDGNSGLVAKLERILRRLLDQDTAPMDIILFLDAVDEFDGHLDMISNFLKGFLNIPAKSKTRVKACVSSRPWKTLYNHFSSSLNISLQDCTRSDIEDFTASSLAASHISNPSIIQLIPTIITRANGVFLWVKLAIQELSATVTKHSGQVPRGELEETLRKLPDDLEDFYNLIIERINKPHRRRAYVLLELLVRQGDPPAAAAHIRRAVLMSGCNTFQEAQDELEKYSLPFAAVESQETKERVRNDLTAWSGGLVELQRGYPQFMHQTVLEYVMGLSFKRRVIGDLATIFTENGHSFHLKYWLYTIATETRLRSITDQELQIKRITGHAEQSELTTGNSHLAYFSSMPVDALQKLLALTPALQKGDALLGFIVSSGLGLCLNDWIVANSERLRFFSTPLFQYPLLSSLLLARPNNVSIENPLTIAHKLLENGYSMEQDAGFFSTLLRNMWLPESQKFINIPEPVMHKLALLALDHGQDPNIVLYMSTDAGSETLECMPLHIAPACVVAGLIARGAIINAPDSRGQTPLDWVLVPAAEAKYHQGKISDYNERYEKCRMLVEAGGTLTRGSSAWKSILDEFEGEGYNTQSIRDRFRSHEGGAWGSRVYRFFDFIL